MLISPLCYALEKSVNFLLNRDSNSAKRLAALEDKVIAVEFSDLKIKLFWVFECQRVRILADWPHAVDVTVSGPLEAIARLGLSKAKMAKDLTVSGDLQVLETFKELFAALDIDWAEQIAPFTGDAAAFRIGKTLQQAGRWLRAAHQSMRANTREYVEEEINLLPSRNRFTDFAQEVRDCQRSVERLSARVQRLKKI